MDYNFLRSIFSGFFSCYFDIFGVGDYGWSSSAMTKLFFNFFCFFCGDCFYRLLPSTW